MKIQFLMLNILKIKTGAISIRQKAQTTTRIHPKAQATISILNIIIRT